MKKLFCVLMVIFIGLLPLKTLAQDATSNLVGFIASDVPINVRDRPNGAVISSLPPNMSVNVLDQSKDGTWLSVDLPDGKTGWVSASFVRVMQSAIPADLVPLTPDNAAQLENLTRFAASLSGIVVFSPDGRLLASASQQNTIDIYDVRTKILITTLTKHTDILSGIAFSPDGSEMASSSWDGLVVIWNTQTWGARAQFEGDTDGVNSVTYSPDGTMVASVAQDGLLNIWNVRTGERVQSINMQHRRMGNVLFSPDGTKIAAVGDHVDSVLIVWDAATGKPLWQKSPGGNLHIVFSPDGSTLMLANGSPIKVTGYAVETGQAISTIPLAGADAASLAINPSGTLVAAGAWSGAFAVGSVEDKKRLFSDTSLKDGPAASVVLAFSPDGRLLVTSDTDHNIYLWGVHGTSS